MARVLPPSQSLPRTVKVRADNRRGFLIVNESELTDDDVLYGDEPAGGHDGGVEGQALGSGAIVDPERNAAAEPTSAEPKMAGGDAPSFMHGLTLVVLQAMKYDDLKELGRKGELTVNNVPKATLVAELAKLAGLA